jgi:beta-mannosidase
MQWIDKSDWEYRTIFTADEALLAKEQIELIFKGLDTYADIYLNDQKILTSDNFFIEWKVDLKPFLKKGINELKVYFHSPIEKGLELLAKNGKALPASNDQSIQGGVGDHKVSIFTRKPGYHYGWDWGPRLVTSGIWRPVYINAFNRIQIQDVYFRQKLLSKEKARLNAEFTLFVSKRGAYELSIVDGEKTLIKKKVQLESGIQSIQIPFKIKSPKYWWTHDLGEPYLYNMSAIVKSKGKELDRVGQKIGLRTVRLVQNPDEKGKTFYVELNGFPLFAKGANYIPNDIFLPRVEKEHYDFLIKSSIQANMNMLRVWGGGIYENDIFYDLCDKYGLLVWQDFMFACSMYPGDSIFLDNVKKEAQYNLTRLRNHPSIGLWCGNNEIDVAWAHFKEDSGWGWKQRYSKAERTEIWNDYEKVFHQILPEMTEAYSPGTFYWPSSPYASEGKHANYDSKEGDMHYWGVWHGLEPFEAFSDNIGRFVSEYGFQSFPEFNSVKQFTLPEDWNIESEVMSSHQRSGIGNLRIMEYMADHYKVPRDFKDILYIGQLLQAKGIGYAIEAHRRAKPYCMGTLYWQLNDCWPVASWSGIDSYLNWKAMHYAVAEAFKPVILSSVQRDSMVDLYLISDRMKVSKFSVSVELHDFLGHNHQSLILDIEVPENTTVQFKSIDLRSISREYDLDKHYLIIKAFENDELIDEHYHYFNKEKDLSLNKDYHLDSKLTRMNDNAYKVDISSDVLLKGLYLFFDNAPGHFSKNYFDLPANKTVSIEFKLKKYDQEIGIESLKHICLQDIE